MTPFVTVIVPVRNEAAHIAATLAQILNQSYDSDRYEILVVDGQSTDVTAAIVRGMMREHPQLRLLDNPNRLSSAARNIGVQQARGDYVVIIDGHCEIRNQNYLADMVRAFERTGADCLGRPQPLDISGATPLQRAIALARSSPLGHHPASHIYSSNGGPVKPQSVAIAYRSAVFDQVGLFDERFDACEDVEFNHRVDRAGLRCHFAPELAVHYRPRDSLAGLFRQMQRYGRGRIRLLLKHPETFSVAVFVPAMFFIAVVALPFLGFAHRGFAIAGTSLGSVYLQVLLIVGLAAAFRRKNVSVAILMPLVFATIHAGAAWGVLRESGSSLIRWIVPAARRRTIGNPAIR